MTNYNKKTIFENRSRASRLIEFREKIIAYFNANPPSVYLSENHDNAESSRIRFEINTVMDDSRAIIGSTGVIPILHWSPAPAVGGYRQDVDLVINMFHLDQYQIPPSQLLDQIERAIGKLNNDSTSAFIRTLNPFFWIDRILRYVARSPFNILRSAGINADKIESSLIGKIGKLVTYVLTLLIMILTILQLTGLLDNFNTRIREIVKKNNSNHHKKGVSVHIRTE